MPDLSKMHSDVKTPKELAPGRLDNRKQGRAEERRKEPRIDVDGKARIKVINPLMSTGPAVQARVLNISANGLKLQVARFALIGALVQVRLPEKIVFGQIRYCVPAGTEFHIGIQVKEIF